MQQNAHSYNIRHLTTVNFKLFLWVNEYELLLLLHLFNFNFIEFELNLKLNHQKQKPNFYTTLLTAFYASWANVKLKPS